MQILLFDAECDGLYGAFLSIAAIRYEDGKEVQSFYAAVQNPSVTEPWVQQNVVPHLKNAPLQCKDEAALLSAFAAFWRANIAGCYALADVPYPVESRLLLRLREYGVDGPYPLLDLASMLYAKGYDPLVTRNEIVQTNLVAHDARNDVRQTYAVWEALQAK